MRRALVFALLAFLAGLAGAQGGYAIRSIGNTGYSNHSFGTAIAFVGDVDGDQAHDYLVYDLTAWTAASPGGPVGEVRLVSGAAGGTIRSHRPDNGGPVGRVLAAAGDLDLDGVPDYGIGDPLAGGPAVPQGVPAGRVDFVSGATGATLFTLTGGFFSTGDQLGSAVCAPGDVTGDGIVDVVVGAEGASSTGGLQHGKVLIRSGANGAIVTLYGLAPNSYFGSGVCGPGDLNGDGIADLVVGAAGGLGSVFAYAGGTGALLWTATGVIPNEGFGRVLASAGDFDGDGTNDVLVGAPLSVSIGGPSSAGHAFVLSGSTGAQLWSAAGATPAERFGAQVVNAGDVNGDNFADVLVSAPDSPGPPPGAVPGSGSVHLVFGPAGAATQIVASGGAPFERLGTGLAGGGLVDADAVPDFVAGSPNLGPAGQVIVVSGATSSTLYPLIGTAPAFGIGHFASAVEAGDQDGDGLSDLALGLVGQLGPIALVSGVSGQLIRLLPGGPLPGTPYTDPGLPVACVGDVDLDGFSDIAVAAATGPNAAGLDTVRMDVVSGANGALLHSTTWSACRLTLVRMIAPADYDGDSIRDLVVSLPIDTANCAPPLTPGRVEIRSGATGVLIRQASSAAVSDWFGVGLDAVGDVDGDAVVDLAVGAPLTALAFGPGAVHVLSGATLGPIFTVNGSGTQSLGGRVAGIGDVSGDGIPDFAAGDLLPSAVNVSVHLWSGAGGAPLGTLTAPAGAIGFGKEIAGVGDVDGDGIPDVAVGAPFSDGVPAATMPAVGKVFVFSGAGGPALLVRIGSAANVGLGGTIAAAGDRNQDGLADVFAAAHNIFTVGEIVSFAGVPTGSQAIGSACTLASGRQPALAAFGGDPTSATGNPFFGFIVSNGNAGALGAIAMGTSTTSWGGAALPLSLAPALPGCSLYVSVDNLVPFTLGAGFGGLGALKLPIAVPMAPGLAGITAHLQAYVADSGAAPLPGAVTRGLTIVVQ